MCQNTLHLYISIHWPMYTSFFQILYISRNNVSMPVITWMPLSCKSIFSLPFFALQVFLFRHLEQPLSLVSRWRQDTGREKHFSCFWNACVFFFPLLPRASCTWGGWCSPLSRSAAPPRWAVSRSVWQVLASFGLWHSVNFPTIGDQTCTLSNVAWLATGGGHLPNVVLSWGLRLQP